MKAVLSNRLYLQVTPDQKDKIKEELTYIIPSNIPQGLPIYICDVVNIKNNLISIPIGKQNYITENYEVVDKRDSTEAEFPDFSFTLRPSQQEVYDKITDSCIIRANPSWGKTFTSLAIAKKLGKKTLVIVHTLFLRDQWVNEIKTRYGIDPGVIADGVYSVSPIITVANVQSLKNRMTKIAEEKFGTVIVDEAHHTPATIFKSVLDRIRARYKIGLTATPWRRDGKHILLNDYFGPDTIDTKDENRLNPKIRIINSGIKLPGNIHTPWQNRISKVYENHKYLELVVNIAEACAKKGHKVLVVCDRNEFLENCHQMLEDDSCIVIGKTKKEDRDFIAKGKSIGFGSIKIFSEGVNIPRLSCLILATPINNRSLLEQLLGRISRPFEGKLPPEVYDISLDGGTGRNQLSQRINYYYTNGLTIEYL